MALTVEDGSIVTGAESYTSVSDADTYHANLGNAAWALLSTAEKEEALRGATQYMLQKYGGNWLGYRVNSTQVLDWPRQFVPISDLLYIEYVTNTTIPDEIKSACASLALRANTEELIPDEEQQVLREKVDVIETEYAEFSTARKKYIEVDLMLKKYLSNTAGALQMIRV